MRTRDVIVALTDLACAYLVVFALVGSTRAPNEKPFEVLADGDWKRPTSLRQAYDLGYKIGREHAEHTLIRDHGDD